MAYTPTTWTTGDTITASALNKIEQGIADGGGGRYDAYDYVITQLDNNTPVIEKGSYTSVYDALQAKQPVVGLYVRTSTPGTYHDASCWYVNLSYTNYYSSADRLECCGIAYAQSQERRVYCEWDSSDGITVYRDAL